MFPAALFGVLAVGVGAWFGYLGAAVFVVSVLIVGVVATIEDELPGGFNNPTPCREPDSSDVHRHEDAPTLPDIDRVRHTARALALADAILSPEWEFRRYSFDSAWHPALGLTMASMRDGSGSEYFLLFENGAAVGKVFDRDAPRAAADLVQAVPDIFAAFKREPAFSLDAATQFFWRQAHDAQWHCAPGHATSRLLEPLASGLDGYHPWAEDYYERTIDRAALAAVFASLRVTPDTLRRLDPSRSLDDLKNDLDTILGTD